MAATTPRTPALPKSPATAFARKYGVATIDPSNLFIPFGKSGPASSIHAAMPSLTDINLGFTPTDPLVTILPRTAEELRIQHETYTFQGRWFAGYSSRALEDMGAFPDPEAVYKTLKNPIQ